MTVTLTVDKWYGNGISVLQTGDYHNFLPWLYLFINFLYPQASLSELSLAGVCAY